MAARKTSIRKVLDFLNTQIGFWLLTTVLVGLVTGVFSIYQRHNANSLIRERLKVELRHQLKDLENRLARVKRHEYGFGLFRESLENINAIKMPLYPENRGVSFTTLLTQLKAISQQDDPEVLQQCFQSTLVLDSYSRITPSVLSPDSVKRLVNSIETNEIPKFNKLLGNTTNESKIPARE